MPKKGKAPQQSKPRSYRVVPKKADHNPEAAPVLGEDTRRLEYQEFCFDLDTKGYSQREIAERLAKKYSLAIVPSHTTIGVYIRSAVVYRNEKITDMRERYLAKAIPRLEAMLKNFLPAATNEAPETGRPLYALRRREFFGSEVEVIDVNSLLEQAKAAEVVLKVMEQARRLLGIGLTEDGGDGQPVTEAKMTSLIVQTVHNHYAGQGGQKQIGSIDLRSGDSGIEALEVGGGEGL
jgi:hypothetical protein